MSLLACGVSSTSEESSSVCYLNSSPLCGFIFYRPYMFVFIYERTCRHTNDSSIYEETLAINSDWQWRVCHLVIPDRYLSHAVTVKERSGVQKTRYCISSWWFEQQNAAPQNNTWASWFATFESFKTQTYTQWYKLLCVSGILNCYKFILRLDCSRASDIFTPQLLTEISSLSCKQHHETPKRNETPVNPHNRPWIAEVAGRIDRSKGVSEWRPSDGQMTGMADVTDVTDVTDKREACRTTRARTFSWLFVDVALFDVYAVFFS